MVRRAGSRVTGGFDEKKNPLTLQQIQEREAAFKAANPVAKNETQIRAAEQGVPLQAFRKSDESQREFSQRLQAEPTQAVLPTQTAQENVNIRTQTGRLATEGIEQVFPDAVRQAQEGSAEDAPLGQFLTEKVKPLLPDPMGKLNATPQEAQDRALSLAGGAVAVPLASLAATAAISAGAIGVTGGLVGGVLSGFSISKFRSAFTTGKQAKLESDMSEATDAARAIAKGAAANPSLSLAQLQTLESELINTAGKLHVAYANDPLAVASGKDVEGRLQADLTKIQNYIEIVQRYQQTSNVAALQAEIGFEDTQNVNT